MSKDQTTQPAQRITLSVATGPNPPWTGVYFTCERCAAHYQLCAADELKEVARNDHRVDDAARSFETPPCWTCGFVNIVKTPRFEPEGNPS